ncbi:hypothetical protein QUA41_22135 [Microcoleus sp. Pol11C1]|uniref:hypothetical protein n=1 Tax=unclassified Microcoleus TaxID=2642155 RepID=UPI002FD5D763
MKTLMRLKSFGAAVLAIVLFTLYLTSPVMTANSGDLSQLLKDNCCVSFLWKHCDLSAVDLRGANLQ